MFEAAALAVVLAGAAVGWVLLEARRLGRGLARWAGVAVVAVLVGTLVPGIVERVRTERTDLKHERDRTHELAYLNTTIDSIGGYRHVRACGEPTTIVEYASALAWYTRLDVGYVGYLPDLERQKSYPIVIFTPRGRGGWSVDPVHIRPAQRAACRDLRARYVVTPRHPRGLLLRG
jgi:hypothetical protein